MYRFCGAEHVILCHDENFREAVMRLTAGKGVDVVYHAVGKDTLADTHSQSSPPRTVRKLRRRVGPGRPTRAAAPRRGGLGVFHAAATCRLCGHARRNAPARERLVSLGGGGELIVTLDRVFALADVAVAHRYLEAGRSRGKLLLAMRAKLPGEYF